MKSACSRWRELQKSAVNKDMEDHSDPLLEVNDLKMHFPVKEGILLRVPASSISAVDGVISLNIQLQVKHLGLVGESGCGKSTLGRCIARLIQTHLRFRFKFEGNEISDLKGSAA